MARFDVVAFDLDGTLLRGTTVSLLTAERLGRGKELAALERRYAAGEIDNVVIADTSAAWLTGREDVLEVLDAAPLASPGGRAGGAPRAGFIGGIGETVGALHEAGVVALIATITWRAAAERLAARFGFDAACGAELHPDGTTTVCDEHDKAAFVVGECE